MLMVGFLFLDVLSKNLVILGSQFLLSFESVNSVSLLELLSSDSLLSNKSLDLWSFEECLILSLDLSLDNILSHIILLSEREELSNGASSLGSSSLWSISVSDTFNIFITLLLNAKGDDSKVWTYNASSNRLSLSLTSSSWSVCCGSFLQ